MLTFSSPVDPSPPPLSKTLFFPLFITKTFRVLLHALKVHKNRGKQNREKMRNYRFKFSDMIPNAWFFKLKDMGRGNSTHSKKKKQSSLAASTTHSSSSKPKQSPLSNPRKSHYFTRELTPTDRFYTSPKNPKIIETNSPEPPRRSSKQSLRKRASKSSPKLASSSVSGVWTKSDSQREYSSSSPFDSSPDESDFPEPEFRTDRVLPTESFDEMVFWSHSNAEEDIVINVDNNSIARKDDKLDEFNSFSEVELPPIIAKPEKFNDIPSDFKKRENEIRSRVASYEEINAQRQLKVKIMKENKATIREQKRFSVNSPGVRLRIHSPRIASKKIQGHGGRRSMSSGKGSRRSLSHSFAVVKSSFDPQRDFRESMVEMIVMNNIRKSKDLEDLLACYLSLNSDEYHDLIIRVFKQIWLDLTDNNR